MGAHDTLTPTPVRMRGRQHLGQDIRHLMAGRLDPRGFLNGYRPMLDPVCVRTTSLVPDSQRVSRDALVDDPQAFGEGGKYAVWDARGRCYRDARFGMQRRVWREIRNVHNLQLNVGKNQLQRIGLFGDIGTGFNASVATGTATVPTATTWTGAAASFATGNSGSGNTALQGHTLFVANAITSSAFTNPVVGVIMSNTATVATVDQWYAVPITGGVGTTPSANSAAFVLPGGTIGWWVALSTSTSAAAATDVTRSADGLWADGTSGGTATEQNTNGLSRAYVGTGSTTAPTFSAAQQYQFGHTWTYTGAVGVTIGKVILFNSLAAAGTIPFLETLLSATASVSANGDTIQVTWTITI